MYPILTSCPVCAGELTATRLQCTTCGTALEGQFALGRLGRLNRDQLRFVELLVKNRGNINQVANDLNVSYTTARTRMDEIVAALGYTPQSEEPGPDRREVLRRLEAGEINAEEALKLLRR
ncbi:MAG: Fis family transcriptional regulator [Herpetosiphonaceae bacterium]|nr:MAG: Fis family transcriptional regulator [Herpetosiphonaceae bacterium]